MEINKNITFKVDMCKLTKNYMMNEITISRYNSTPESCSVIETSKEIKLKWLLLYWQVRAFSLAKDKTNQFKFHNKTEKKIMKLTSTKPNIKETSLRPTVNLIPVFPNSTY